MDARDIRAKIIGNALSRFKRFTACLTEDIGRRAGKRIGALIDRGLENETDSLEFVHLVAMKILKEVKQSNYLADKLTAFGDYEVCYTILLVSLGHEANKKKPFWRFWRPLVFRSEEKRRLIDFLLAHTSKMQIFGDLRMLLCLARVVPYECQQKLLREYLAVYGEFTTPADFLDVYDMWGDLSPDLREQLRELMKAALMHFRFRMWKKDQVGEVEVVENKNREEEPKPGSN